MANKRELSFVDQPHPKRPNSSLGLRSDSVKSFGQIPLQSFDTSRFPTRSNVLCRFIFERELSKQRTKNDIAKQIYLELLDIYQKGLAIPKPTIFQPYAEKQIAGLFDDWNKASQHQKQNRLSKSEKLFVDDLPKMFDIIAPNAEEEIRLDRIRSDADKKDDIEFLRDQRGARQSRQSKVDNRYVKSFEAKLARNVSLAQRQLDQSLHVSSPKRQPTQKPIELMPKQLRPRGQSLAQKNDDCESDEGEESSKTHLFQKIKKPDSDFQQSRFLRENRNAGQSKIGSVAKDPAVLMALDRTITSSRNAFKILAPAATAMGQDIQKTAISSSTIERERKKVRAKEAAEIKASFQPPKRLEVQFDAKILTDMSGISGDRLAVVVSGESADCKEGFLISARCIKDGTGKTEAEEVISSLKDWGLESIVYSMCFDTTSSNTGWKKGACVLIEKGLKRPLLWLACLHHVFELLLKTVWQTLFGIDMEPSYAEFREFQKKWDTLDKNNFEYLNPKSWMKPWRLEVIQFLKSLLDSEKQPRDDYRECIELVLVVLADPPKNYTFKKPGAFHKARFMAPWIYGIKIFLFRKQLGKSRSEVLKLERFVIFVCLFYVKFWFTAPLAAEAPFMCLQIYKNMLQYKKHDKTVASAVLEKFLGHTWYFNQEYVPLSLFSKNVSDQEKVEIAKKLSKVKPPKKYECGFPNPVLLPLNETGLARQLSDAIMGGSLFIFDVLGFGKDWLNMPITQWESNKDYCEMKSWVKHLKVTNDCAERGVKLITDYANSLTKDPVDRQNLLQIAQMQRKLFPTDLSKTTFSANYKASEK